MLYVHQESFDFSLDDSSHSRDSSISTSSRDTASYTVDVTDILEEWGLLEEARTAEFSQWKDRVLAAARLQHGGTVRPVCGCKVTLRVFTAASQASFHVRRGCHSISMDGNIMASFFKPVVEAVGSCVRSTAALREVVGLKFVILAGGFSASRVLRCHITALFPSGRGGPLVIQVDSPSNAIAGVCAYVHSVFDSSCRS